MNIMMYGKDVARRMALVGYEDQIVGKEYPLHVALEGTAAELASPPFGKFIPTGATFAVIPATPEIVEHLIFTMALHEGARLEAEREADFYRAQCHDQDAGLRRVGVRQDYLDRDIHRSRRDIPGPGAERGWSAHQL